MTHQDLEKYTAFVNDFRAMGKNMGINPNALSQILDKTSLSDKYPEYKIYMAVYKLHYPQFGRKKDKGD